MSAILKFTKIFNLDTEDVYSTDTSTQVSSKRKSELEVERCTKKKGSQECRSTLSKPNYDLLSDEIILGLKRRLRLEDVSPAKKIKQVQCRSGPSRLTLP
jgi:hypothetical protein